MPSGGSLNAIGQESQDKKQESQAGIEEARAGQAPPLLYRDRPVKVSLRCSRLCQLFQAEGSDGLLAQDKLLHFATGGHGIGIVFLSKIVS